ncbi:hypothetical protein V1478_018775 [Vespula squamosa]|uniref:Uncharacterized protein n=1 Tax=Vespula squamosa TaxID=30214 RepID=A0ABD1ZTQ7_VESSQ
MRRIASTFFPGESPRVDTVHPHDSTSYPVWAWSSRWRRKLFSREYTTRDIFEFGGGEANGIDGDIDYEIDEFYLPKEIILRRINAPVRAIRYIGYTLAILFYYILTETIMKKNHSHPPRRSSISSFLAVNQI